MRGKLLKMYEYKSIVKKIVDADTIDVEIDLGFKMKTEQRLRLARIDAWEVRGEERVKGLKAKEFVLNVIPVGTVVKVRTEKTGKYGRYIAEVVYMPPHYVDWVPGEMCNLSDELLEAGHATVYEG